MAAKWTEIAILGGVDHADIGIPKSMKKRNVTTFWIVRFSHHSLSWQTPSEELQNSVGSIVLDPHTIRWNCTYLLHKGCCHQSPSASVCTSPQVFLSQPARASGTNVHPCGKLLSGLALKKGGRLQSPARGQEEEGQMPPFPHHLHRRGAF